MRHGNLAEQNRIVGPVRGADTTRPASDESREARRSSVDGRRGVQIAVGKGTALQPPIEIAEEAGCLACH